MRGAAKSEIKGSILRFDYVLFAFDKVILARGLPTDFSFRSEHKKWRRLAAEIFQRQIITSSLSFIFFKLYLIDLIKKSRTAQLIKFTAQKLHPKKRKLFF